MSDKLIPIYLPDRKLTGGLRFWQNPRVDIGVLRVANMVNLSEPFSIVKKDRADKSQTGTSLMMRVMIEPTRVSDIN